MSDWTDTAKRMRDHPKWEWWEGMLYRAVSAEDPLGRRETTQRIPPSHCEPLEHLRATAFPDLTDWATVGIILGMVVEAATEDPFCSLSQVAGGWEAFCTEILGAAPIPGQALGELWLKLVEP